MNAEPEELPIHYAARRGDIATLERLLHEGVDLNAPCDLGDEDNAEELTPLMVAARSVDGADVSTLVWLLSRGADLYATSYIKTTAAWYAAERTTPDQAARLRFLLDAGLNPREIAFNGRPLMLVACRSGDPARVRLLLERGASPEPVAWQPQRRREEYDSHLQWREERRRSGAFIGLDYPLPQGEFNALRIPLFQAAASGSAECVQLLLDAGVDVNIRASDGSTALAHAGSPEVVALLLAAGADRNVWIGYHPEDLLGFVLQDGAIGANVDRPERLAVAQALLDAGAPLEQTDKNGWTRLYRAAIGLRADAVDWLLARGVSLAPDDRGSTPLHVICWHTGSDVTERIIGSLVAAGISLEARDNEGRTPLHKAAGGDGGNGTAIEMLLEMGAEVDPVDAIGQTPLHLAAKRAELYCIHVLIAAGADLLRQDNEGITPVELARKHEDSWKRIVAEDKPSSTVDDETRRTWHAEALGEATEALARLLAASVA